MRNSEIFHFPRLTLHVRVCTVDKETALTRTLDLIFELTWFYYRHLEIGFTNNYIDLESDCAEIKLILNWEALDYILMKLCVTCLWLVAWMGELLTWIQQPNVVHLWLYDNIINDNLRYIPVPFYTFLEFLGSMLFQVYGITITNDL